MSNAIKNFDVYCYGMFEAAVARNSKLCSCISGLESPRLTLENVSELLKMRSDFNYSNKRFSQVYLLLNEA